MEILLSEARSVTTGYNQIPRTEAGYDHNQRRYNITNPHLECVDSDMLLRRPLPLHMLDTRLGGLWYDHNDAQSSCATSSLQSVIGLL
jgi:hypothetical protein